MRYWIISLLFLSAATADRHHELAEKYDNFHLLSSPAYELYWSYDSPTTNISVAVRVNTIGWVGFGISPNGGMPSSDVIMGWVTDGGEVHFNDRYVPPGPARIGPKVDSFEDWTLLQGYEEDGWTILEFWRLANTKDFMQDIVIEKGFTPVIFSWSLRDPVAPNDIPYHESRRGTQSVTLIADETPKDFKTAESILFKVENVTIPPIDTAYWCQAFILPKELQNTEGHMIKFEASIHQPSAAHVHHMLLYECDEDIAEIIRGLPADQRGALCYVDPFILAQCLGKSTLAGWAVGGGPTILPSDVSLSFGGNSSSGVFVLEMHYDNPKLVSDAIDSSGINITYVHTPRQYNAGIAGIGHDVISSMLIPPKQEDFIVTGACRSDCTKKYLDEDGVTAFSSLLHTHLAGSGITIRHFSSGIEIEPPLDEDSQYDFNFQQFRNIKPRKIFPGDELVVECHYNTTNRNKTVYGGFGTYQEMCLAFIIYYPRNNRVLHACANVNTGSELKRIIGENNSDLVDNYLWGPNRFLLAEQLPKDLNEYQWTPEIISYLEKSYQNNEEYLFCTGNAEESSSLKTVHATSVIISSVLPIVLHLLYL